MGKFTKDKRVTKNSQYSKHDIYYRKAKEECYRARSAYKLLQIHDVFQIFNGAERVLDLCGAPGSWSQVCRKKLGENGFFNNEDKTIIGQRIVSVDLQETAPIQNVHHIVGDITRKQTLNKILQAFKGNLCDLVICDGAPDITGFHDMDQYVQSQLLVAALNITLKLLKDGGKFVAKIFKGSQIVILPLSAYHEVFMRLLRPNSSRESSVENFLIGIGFLRDNLQVKGILNIELSTFLTQIQNSKMSINEQKVFGFVTCGDLSSYDQQLQTIIQQEQLLNKQKNQHQQ